MNEELVLLRLTISLGTQSNLTCTSSLLFSLCK